MFFLSVDFEMTGMDSDHDSIVSVGWVPIRKLAIDLEDAFHCLIKAPLSVGDSAGIHGIHDYELKRGLSLCDVVGSLLDDYREYTLVFHHADLDLRFLQSAISGCGKRLECISFMDTMDIERRRLLRTGRALKWDSLTLENCLKRHGLPAGNQHEALGDAFSCAQLFLCQVASYRNKISIE
ncbi:MAG: 3'-5' exonuclease [Pseudohongiellaceae bacterium]